jgi:cysteine-rich repeat protein
VDGFCVPPGESETGDGEGEGEGSGDGDGEGSGDGDGDGDGDGEGSGDGDGDGDCEPGTLGCPCGAGDACDPELTCVDGTCLAASGCGDGVVDPGEACDDGNAIDTDACLSNCVAASCGDGFVGPGEGCDDGNDIDDDACTNACILASCGDGMLQEGESCDDGNAVDTDACLSSCLAANCGDGFVWADMEECDDANVDDTDACLSSCVAASCGDGFVGPGEGCDDANGIDGDACSNACVPASCGDGVVQLGEDCDDGDLDDDDACLSSCAAATCGDGFVWTGMEECDDQNLDNDDGCVETCMLPSCGDGYVQPTNDEHCDDANDVPLDGCESDCTGSGVLTMALGQTHTCAVMTDGQTRCWGGDDYGLLGNTQNLGSIGDEPGEMPAPPAVLGGTPIEIAAGSGHNCALFQGGVVRCWGFGWDGALGYNSILHVYTVNDMPPDNVNVGGVVTQLVAGSDHNCALLANGAVRCWGSAGYGQLGYGNGSDQGDDGGEMPTSNVNIGGIAVQVTAGTRHSCVLLDTGAVRCWGLNQYGELGYGHTNRLGDGPGEMPTADVNVGAGTIIKVVAGGPNTCVVLEGGVVRCWGSNAVGQLGEGNTDHRGDQPGEMPPPDIDVGGNVVDILVGSRMCALLDTGAVRCWGSGNGGSLGYGNTDNLGDQPGELPTPDLELGGLVDYLAKGAPGGHTCVVLVDRSVRCWGHSAYGRLGYGGMNHVGDQPGEMPPPPVLVY